MSNIKIFLQYPWKFPDSPYYKNLLNFPPLEVEYLNAKGKPGIITSRAHFFLSQKIKNFIKNTPQRFGITIVNAHKTKTQKKYDLIHCAHCLSKNKHDPWITDLEMLGSLLISGFHNQNWAKKVKKYLYAESCKKIIPWTENVAQKLLQKFPEIKDKVEVVYPAIPFKKINKKKHKKITLIYMARAFHLKGGIFALEIMKRLKQKYNIRGIVISSVPKEIKKRYPEIEIYDLLPQKKVFELMRESDIFFYPSQMDTFGFGILEAMNFGLPSVALKTPVTSSINEIIEDGKTGFLVEYTNPRGYLTKITNKEHSLLKELEKKCEILIKNTRLRKKMSIQCIKIIKEGKFSIRERNKKLKKIYQEAIK